MEFKDRIKELRLDQGLTQTDLGSQFGKTESATRAWELGRTKPDVDTLIEIANYFDVTVDYLLGVSNTKNEMDRQYVVKELANIENKTKLMPSYERQSSFNAIDFFLSSRKYINVSDQYLSDFYHNLCFVIKALSLIPFPLEIAQKQKDDLSQNEKYELYLKLSNMHTNELERLNRYIENICTEMNTELLSILEVDVHHTFVAYGQRNIDEVKKNMNSLIFRTKLEKTDKDEER